MKLINLDELDRRIKLIGKATPHQVVNLIIQMQGEMK